MGMDKTVFMEESIADSDFVLVICTADYAKKANKRCGGVGYEAMIITGELAEDIRQTKFIPVLREGGWDKTSIPRWLKTRTGVDLRGDPCRQHEYENLLRELHREHLKPPAVGSKPNFFKISGGDRLGSAPASGGSNATSPAQNAIAYAFYETKGPGAKAFKMYVIPVDQSEDRFSLKTSDGEVSEGSLIEIARDYLLTDREYVRNGYSRTNWSNASGRREFDLPYCL
jgi:hypothetical protein